MTDKWFEPIGEGAFWVKEGKKGKYLSWEMTFSYNGHLVTTRGVAFKNEFKEGNKPDWKIKVNDAFPAKSREISAPGGENGKNN
jgi:hypothetical protein